MKQTRIFSLAVSLSLLAMILGCEPCKDGCCPVDKEPAAQTAPATEEAATTPEEAAPAAEGTLPESVEIQDAAEEAPAVESLDAATLEDVPGSEEVKEEEKADDLPATLELNAPEVTSEATAGTNPADTNPTAYAPVEMLGEQLEAFVENLEKTLESDEDFEDTKGRIARDANTVAALALVLGLHDQPNPYKVAASNIIAAAQTLAGDADYATTKANFEALKASLKSTDGKNLAWDVPVANLAQLMKEVPLLDGKIKSGIRRFRKTDEMAGYAVALAAIFQVSTANVGETCDATKGTEWIAFCLESRDDAGALANALTAKDKKASQKAYDKLTKSCDECHAIFHQTATK
ncbi:MAG: hypothetical protein Q4D62_06975 [Planctomycetia bacterium]|nr:hypothetical protein [Planctomycetia bacterium]